MERQDLVVDPRFETDVARVENAEALYEEISNWTRERGKYEVMATLGAAGVPCSATLDTKDLHEDPHLVARGFVQKLDLPQHGPVRMLGFPTRMSASEVPMQPAPLLGEHTDYNLGFALPIALERCTTVRFEPAGSDSVTVSSDRESNSVSFPIDVRPGDVRTGDVNGWSAYPAGALWALADAGHPVVGGVMSVTSDVPVGAGLSS